jgi:hypothetical protein
MTDLFFERAILSLLKKLELANQQWVVILRFAVDVIVKAAEPRVGNDSRRGAKILASKNYVSPSLLRHLPEFSQP